MGDPLRVWDLSYENYENYENYGVMELWDFESSENQIRIFFSQIVTISDPYSILLLLQASGIL